MISANYEFSHFKYINSINGFQITSDPKVLYLSREWNDAFRLKKKYVQEKYFIFVAYLLQSLANSITGWRQNW